MNNPASGGVPARPMVTLNSLRDQQLGLNRQLLLAVQLHDANAQESIRQQLTALQEEIDRMLQGR